MFLHLRIFLVVFLRTLFSCGFLLFLLLFMCCLSCKYVNIIPENNHFSPLQPAFYPSIFTLLRGKKCHRRHILVLREPNSTNNFAKNHFFSLSLFRSDNAIFHNKDSISIFYKMQKICKICGYWVEYNYWCFERLKKAIKILFFRVFEGISHIFCVNLYNYARFLAIIL